MWGYRAVKAASSNLTQKLDLCPPRPSLGAWPLATCTQAAQNPLGVESVAGNQSLSVKKTVSAGLEGEADE